MKKIIFMLALVLPMLVNALKEKEVEVRGDEVCCRILPDHIIEASEEDWGKEYLDYILSVKTVSSLDEAIAHINRYNTGHSEAIITEKSANNMKPLFICILLLFFRINNQRS